MNIKQLFTPKMPPEPEPGMEHIAPPRKTGVPRFFELLGRDLWPFYKASFLCCLAFLPGFLLLVYGLLGYSLLFAVGGGILLGVMGAPTLVGLLDTILRSLRDEPGFWWHTYKRSWKQNWKESLAPGAIFGAFFGLWVLMAFLLPEMESAPTAVWICLFLGAFFGLGFFGYLFAQIPLVSLKLGALVKNSALMFLGFFPRTLAATAVMFVYWGLMLLLLPYTIPVLFVLGFWLPCVICMMILYPGLEKVFNIEATISARRDAEINAQMAQSAPVFDLDKNDE